MKRDGTTCAWGENSDGRLGIGTAGAPIATPTLVKVTSVSVALTAPANGTKFINPSSIALTASTVGSLRRVDYYRKPSIGGPLIRIGESSAPPYSLSWTGVKPGAYIVTAKAIDNYGFVSTSNASTITVTKLSGTVATASGTVALGFQYLGWAHWGRDDVNSYNHQSCCGIAISPVTHSGTVTRKTGGLGFTWTNGSPIPTQSTATTASLSVAGAGNSLTFTVPASVGTKVLRVWVSAFKENGSLTASLDDGSGAKYTNTLLSPATDTSPRYRVYTISFEPSASPKTLKVTWKVAAVNSSSGCIRLYAASVASK
jgi:hypothetical protein